MLIETDRLLLRRMTMADLDELVAIHAEPEVRRFMGPFDRAEAMRWMKSSQRDWGERGYGRVAIVERANGYFLGRTGLKYWRQFDETEVGWLLRPDRWGHGMSRR
jgi:RimJ/RimL family protein N-acetyltransferase